MVQLSAMVLAIGVPVAKTMPPPRSSRHCFFRNRSVALWHSAGLGSPFTRSSLVAKGRFFAQCTSSTLLLGLAANRTSPLGGGALAAWRTCRRRCANRARDWLRCVRDARLTVSEHFPYGRCS